MIPNTRAAPTLRFLCFFLRFAKKVGRYHSRGGKRHTAYPSVYKSFDSFLAKKALTAGSDLLFWPNYIGIRGYFELILSANRFYRAMKYFYFGA